MKFVDPIATLQYMGGALPIHFCMAFYCRLVAGHVSLNIHPRYYGTTIDEC